MIRKWTCILAVLCNLPLSSKAQANQWDDLQMLKRGASISVVERRRQSCELVEITATELTCNHDFGRVNRNIVFARDRIREVRLELPDKNHMILGTIAGSLAGGLLGYFGGRQLSDPEARGYSRIYGVPIGGFVGGAIGGRLHRHGPVVYSAVSGPSSGSKSFLR